MKTVLIITVFVIYMFIPIRSFAWTVGGGDVTFSPQNASSVIFSHEKHVDVKGKKCSRCHNSIFQMEKGSTKMDMTEITKGNFCGTCHDGQKAFDVKNQKNCVRCHVKKEQNSV